MIPRLVTEILPCDGFCDGAVAAAGIWHSRNLMDFITIYILAPGADKEPDLDFKSIGYSFIISLPVVLIVLGVVFMCRRTNCEIRRKCCKCCSSDLETEKEDENVDYGAYYFADGERRQDVMEVSF